MKCPNCNENVESTVKFCPECGNPISQSDKNKIRNKVLILGLLAICVCLVFACIIVINNNKKQKFNDYIDKITEARILMLDGTKESIELCDKTSKVWYLCIRGQGISQSPELKEYVLRSYVSKTQDYYHETDYNDFNTGIQNLYADKLTIKTLDDIKKNQEMAKELMKGLQSPPEKLSNCYDIMNDLYESYKIVSDLSLNPSGSYSDYSFKVSQASDDFLLLYDRLDNQLPSKY